MARKSAAELELIRESGRWCARAHRAPAGVLAPGCHRDRGEPARRARGDARAVRGARRRDRPDGLVRRRLRRLPRADRAAQLVGARGRAQHRVPAGRRARHRDERADLGLQRRARARDDHRPADRRDAAAVRPHRARSRTSRSARSGRASPAPTSTAPSCATSRTTTCFRTGASTPATGSGCAITRRRSSTSATTRRIEPGMVFTLEPGLYSTGGRRFPPLGHRRRHGGWDRRAHRVSARPREPHDRSLNDACPVGDRLHGAHQPSRDPGRARLAESRAGRVASRDRARAEAYAREWEIPQAYGSLRGAARRSVDRGRLHLAAEHAALRVVDPRARGGQARALREAALAASAGGRGGIRRRPSAAGGLLSEAFMYRHNPQTARLSELVADGAIGELRLIRCDVQLLALRRRQHPAAAGRRGRRADGRRLLLRLAARGCSPASRSGCPAAAWYGPTGTDWVFAGSCGSPATCSRLRLRHGAAERDELEAIGSEGSLFLDDPWHARKPVIELRREGAVERIELEPEDSYRLELENVSDAIRGEGELLLGREDARRAGAGARGAAPLGDGGSARRASAEPRARPSLRARARRRAPS